MGTRESRTERMRAGVRQRNGDKWQERGIETMDNSTEICGLALGGIDSLSPTVYYGNQKTPSFLSTAGCKKWQREDRLLSLKERQGFFFLSLDCDSKGKTELSATPRPGWYVHTLVFNMYVCISYACREYYKSLKTEYLKISFQVKVIQTLCLQIDGHKLRFWERWLWSLEKSLMFYDYLSLNVKDWAYYWLYIQCLTLYNIQKSRPAYSYNTYF